MANRSYNYTIAETHKGKIYIPYIGIEIEGYSTVFAAVIGMITIAVVIGFPLSFFIGMTGIYIGVVLSILVTFAVVTYSNEVNNETGRNRLKELYFVHIKKYNFVYDSKGTKYYLQPKTKGVIYINACRNHSHL